MTELRDELKIRPEEGAVDYAERVEAVLERHRVETGERLIAHGTMPGESPSEVLERLPVLKTADGIRSAERARRRAQEGNGMNRQKENYVNNDTSTAADDSSRRYRIKSQERDVEKAVSEFESARKRLYRSDGSKVYGEEEHAERLGKLTGDLREKAEAVAAEAQSDVIGYERAVLASSYTDPASLVPATDRGRLETSRAFVKEDCEPSPRPPSRSVSKPSPQARIGWDRSCTPATPGRTWRPSRTNPAGSPAKGARPGPTRRERTARSGKP